MATGLPAGNPARCRWITAVSRDFTGAAAAAPNTPQDCRAHGKLARPRRHSEWSVKPSAKPTQVRTLDLPPIHPQVRHDTGAALRPERERSATPLALPLPRMQPRWLQVSGLARDGLRHRAAGLRRSSPSRNGPAVRDETSPNDATADRGRCGRHDQRTTLRAPCQGAAIGTPGGVRLVCRGAKPPVGGHQTSRLGGRISPA